jgi:ADP-heptose:LPS heptosyltransferase
MFGGAPKFLVIRRDNIGDLICTTPLFSALRTRFPQAEICALVNSYNAPVLERNPDVDAVYSYTKGKHRAKSQPLAAVLWTRVGMIIALRRRQFDYAILAGAPYLPRVLKFARLIKPSHIIGYTEPGEPGIEHIDLSVPYAPRAPMHETEYTFGLLTALGIESAPGPVRVVADNERVLVARQALANQGYTPGTLLIGIHISARKPGQRWPVNHFIELVQRLHERRHASFMLFWSPGEEDNPLHPGDDNKAKAIIAALPGCPIYPCPTLELAELIAGLSVCEVVICSDGGAMHVAAGLSKPILCFFGNSDATRWRPWGVPHVLLQRASRNVADIEVGEAEEGFNQLLTKIHRSQEGGGRSGD